ncbi:MAG TPA: hypothetical protein PKE64_16535 [Anaerolineae bacterium]|nr:hypothetical protein [Anaerolineae bacterium]HMR65617.1 hypothetical protein [Anaerolineae bacterium]
MRTSWPQALPDQSRFIPLSDRGMTDEQVGFATGVFRSTMLRRLTGPTFLRQEPGPVSGRFGEQLLGNLFNKKRSG